MLYRMVPPALVMAAVARRYSLDLLSVSARGPLIAWFVRVERRLRGARRLATSRTGARPRLRRTRAVGH